MGAVCFAADFSKDMVTGPGGLLAPDTGVAHAFDWFARGVLGNFMLAAFGMFCLCLVIQVVASLLLPEPPREEARGLVWEDWREPLRGGASGHGMASHRVLAAVVLVVFLVLYWTFR